MIIRVIKYLCLNAWSTKWSIEKIRSWQLKRINNILDKAIQASAYKAIAKNKCSLDSLDDMGLIKPITKNDLRESPESLLVKTVGVKAIKTGGTTGMPLKLYQENPLMQIIEVITLYFEFRKYGYGFFDKNLILRGGDFKEGELYKKGFNKWQRTMSISTFNLNSDTVDIIVNNINEYKPKNILGYPSAIVSLCELMQKHNLRFNFKIKAIITSSESLTNFQKNQLQDFFETNVYNHYGLSEKCAIAGSDVDTDSMVFNPFYSYVEIVNEKGEKCKKGETGEIIATTLNSYKAPLIRYKTGDLATVISEEDELLRVSRIQGRKSDFLVDNKQNKRFFTNSDEPFWDYIGVIEKYQYIQDVPGRFNLNYVCNKDIDESKLLESVKYVFPDYEVIIKKVEDIPLTKRGKFKYLIQNINDKEF